MATMRDRQGLGPRSFGLLLALLTACSESSEQLPLAPIPLVYKDGLLYARGDISPVLGERCTDSPEEGAPAGSGTDALLIDTGTPLTTLVTQSPDSARQFPHGQVLLYSTRSDGTRGGIQFVRCDIPVVRSDQTTSSFQLLWDQSKPLSLGGVLGGDQLSHFAMSLRFSTDGPLLQLSRGDIATWCRIDRAVIPFKPVGGELAVQLADTVITYPASRVTVGACVEPYADPLPKEPADKCITDEAVSSAITRVNADLSSLEMQSPRDDDLISRFQTYRGLLLDLQSKTAQCPDDQRTLLGDLADDLNLRSPAYRVSGSNMRFLVSTAIPELLLTRTACQRLTGKDCQCDKSPTISMALPGLNSLINKEGVLTTTPDVGCFIALGSTERAALAVVAKQRQLAPCDELARSRRQRYALRPAPELDPEPEHCRRMACLRNLGRDPALLGRRCGYSGLDSDLACNDSLSPIASWIELGGPKADGKADTLKALVLPDSAAVFQSVNADVRNLSAQIDGIIGVATLSRMFSTIDYPQGRLELACRCDSDPMSATACHAYRAITYYTADSCVESDVLTVPPDQGRISCAP
jgi:hypothetical protein